MRADMHKGVLIFVAVLNLLLFLVGVVYTLGGVAGTVIVSLGLHKYATQETAAESATARIALIITLCMFLVLIVLGVFMIWNVYHGSKHSSQLCYYREHHRHWPRRGGTVTYQEERVGSECSLRR